MIQKRMTLSTDSKIYERYENYCERNGIIICRTFYERPVKEGGAKNE